MDMYCAREDRCATDVTMTWKKMSIVECGARVSCACRMLTFWKWCVEFCKQHISYRNPSTMVEGVSRRRNCANWSSSIWIYVHRWAFPTKKYVHRGTLYHNHTRGQNSGFHVKVATYREQTHMVRKYENVQDIRGDCATLELLEVPHLLPSVSR